MEKSGCFHLMSKDCFHCSPFESIFVEFGSTHQCTADFRSELVSQAQSSSLLQGLGVLAVVKVEIRVARYFGVLSQLTV